MSQPPHNDIPLLPSLTIDWERYEALLEEVDATDAQKRELIETLWSIVVTFVDLGFDVGPPPKSCGQTEDPLSDDPPDLVDLVMRELRQERKKEVPWQE